MDVSNVGLALNDRKMTDEADRTISNVCRNSRRCQEKENEVKICHSWKIIANQSECVVRAIIAFKDCTL